VSQALQVIDECSNIEESLKISRKWRIIGSSLGGYLATRWAQLHPELVDRILLLAPAFDIPDILQNMLGPAEMEMWEKEGFKVRIPKPPSFSFKILHIS
jgi:pimeloyl-ACP methyl ester carboxylesterase